MSLTAIFIIDVIMLTAIGFFVWSYCRGTRISTLELVATYKLNLRDTERKIRLAVEERIARVDLNETAEPCGIQIGQALRAVGEDGD